MEAAIHRSLTTGNPSGSSPRVNPVGRTPGLPVAAAPSPTPGGDIGHDPGFLSFVAEASLDPVVLCRRDGLVVGLNVAAAEFTGWTAVELQGQSFQSVFQATPHIPADWWVDQALPAHPILKLSILGKDGVPLPAQLRLFPIPGPAGSGFVWLTLKDCRERQTWEQRCSQAQRMEYLARVCGGIAHDLNNVFAPLVVTTEMLRDRIKDKDGESLISLVERSTNRGVDLVKRFLAVARGTPGEAVETAPKHLLRELERALAGPGTDARRSSLNLPKESWNAIVDPALVLQALVPLTLDLAKPWPSDVQVDLITANEEWDEVRVKQAGVGRVGSFVTLEVRPRQSGVPERQVSFARSEPFIDPESLTLARLVIENQKGFFVDPQEAPHSRGQVIKVCLPARVPTVAQKPAVAVHGPAHPRRGVLVIESDTGVRQSLEKALEHQGYTVFAAATGIEAMELASKHPTSIHAALLDTHQGVPDAHTLRLVLHRLVPHIELIGMSSLPGEECRFDNELAPWSNVLSKPFSAAELARALAPIRAHQPAG